jgi:hypothetical protein
VNYLQDNWVHWLPLAKFAYNNSIHASIGVTQFFTEKGFYPSIAATVRAIPADRSVPNVPDAEAWAEKLVELQAAIEQRRNEVTATQWTYADRCTKACKSEVGDMVWLSGKNIQTKRPSKKLNHRFHRPYLVVERKGTQAYCSKLSQQASSIYNVFHVLLLEPYVSDRCAAPEPLLPIEIDGEKKYELKEILQSEYRYGTLRYCVKYQGYTAEQSKWLPAENPAHVQDMVCEFHALHPNQPKPVG